MADKEFGIEKVEYKIFDGQEVVLTEKDVRNICGANSQYLTRSEIELFMKTAKYRKLNPFLRELYLLKTVFTKNGETKPQPAQIIVSKQAVMMIAEEHPAYDGLEHGITVQKANGETEDRVGCIKLNGETLVGGWAKVYRKDRRVPFVARLDLKEYSKAKKYDDGKEGKGTWDTMICTMIDKCATVSAMRLAFPQQLGGLYTNEEAKNSNFEPTETEQEEITETPTTETPKEVVYDIPAEYYATVTNSEMANVQVVATATEDKESEMPFLDEPETKTEIKPVRYEKINGVDYPVYPYNPEYMYWYGTREGFPSKQDKYNLVDLEPTEDRVPVQEKELKTKAEPKAVDNG